MDKANSIQKKRIYYFSRIDRSTPFAFSVQISNVLSNPFSLRFLFYVLVDTENLFS